MSLYTEVFLNKFITGDNADTMRQMLGVTVEEVNFMLAEINGSSSVQVAVTNNQDAVDNSFELKITAPENCTAFEALRFLFYGVNNSAYTSSIIPAATESDTDNLDKEINIGFTPV